MKITFYAYGHETGSTYLMCADMATMYERQGHETVIVTQVSKIPHTDVLVVAHPKDILTILRMAGRYVRVDQLVLLFSPHPNGFWDAELAYMLLTAQAHPVVCHSRSLYEALRGHAKRLFAPGVFRTLDRRLYYVPFGILDDFRDTGRNDRNHWIAPFNRCDDEFKNFSAHAVLTQRLQAVQALRGYPITHHLRYADPSLSRVKERDVSMYEAQPQPDSRQKYVEDAQKYGVFVCMSKNESFGLMYLELLASGCVGVFMDRPWVHKLLPGYRLVADRAHLEGLAMSVYEDFDRARDYVQRQVQPYIDANYRLTGFCNQLLQVLGENKA